MMSALYYKREVFTRANQVFPQKKLEKAGIVSRGYLLVGWKFHPEQKTPGEPKGRQSNEELWQGRQGVEE